MGERVKLGEVCVDSGAIWVGDPCYVIGGDASHAFDSWDEYVNTLINRGHFAKKQSVSEPAGEGIGMHVQTLYGDGSYPVYAELDGNGRVARIAIDFEYGDED